MLFGELWHYTPHRQVLVEVIFELLQLSYHRVPTAFRDTDSEHDEEGVEPRLFNDDAVLS